MMIPRISPTPPNWFLTKRVISASASSTAPAGSSLTPWVRAATPASRAAGSGTSARRELDHAADVPAGMHGGDVVRCGRGALDRLGPSAGLDRGGRDDVRRQRPPRDGSPPVGTTPTCYGGRGWPTRSHGPTPLSSRCTRRALLDASVVRRDVERSADEQREERERRLQRTSERRTRLLVVKPSRCSVTWRSARSSWPTNPLR